MAYSYRPVDRSQRFLLPPDMADWLPGDHLVWVVVEVVERLDTSVLHAGHPRLGVGRRAYDPDMLLALLIYAYCSGVRSSRQIERLCRVDVAFRLICANDIPDHTTIARFRQFYDRAAQGLFVQVLAVCAAAGMAQVGVVAVDGTKMGAAASLKANRSRAQLEAEVAALFAAAEEADAAEEGRLGRGVRGDELPADLADPRRRAGRLEQALAVVAAQEAQAVEPDGEGEGGGGGRPRAGDQLARAEEAVADLEAELASPDSELRRAEAAALAAVAEAEAAEAKKVTRAGRKMGRPRKTPGGGPVKRTASRLARAQATAERRRRHALARVAKARQAAVLRAAKASRVGPARANVTDPDSRIMKTPAGWLQGYNAQAAVNTAGIVLAASVVQDRSDMHQCAPMTAAVLANLSAAGITEAVGTMLFDAGYCSVDNLTFAGPDRLIATTKSSKLRRAALTKGFLEGDPPADASPIQAMEHRLRTQPAAALYGLRQHSIEPVFGHTKSNRGYRHFLRRGLAAVNAEWQLMMTAQNITKLFTARPHPLAAI